MSFETRSGWGRTNYSRNVVRDVKLFQPTGLNRKENSGLPIGLGRSYGDSATTIGGDCWTCRNLNEIEIDVKNKIATCGAGATIGELERTASEYGLFPPVVPGTEFVTIGGAIASNIHGKSHHTFGAFGEQLIQFDLLDASGNTITVAPEGPNKNIFWATVGGMGLTGIIISAKINLVKIETTFIRVSEKRVSCLEEALTSLRDYDREFLYTVAWIDFSGDYRGRGLVSGGNHANLLELPEKLSKDPLARKLPRKLRFPKIFSRNLVNTISVRLFNEIWFRKPLTKGYVHFQKFLHPLDSILNWNHIYGRDGFVQYQIVIPNGEEDFLRRVMVKLKDLNAASFLVVLKKFGDGQYHYLSFPREGWTLAVDLPAGIPDLDSCLDYFDEELTRIGGSVYLTKDSRLSHENFKEMYPDYEKWKTIKNEIDPSGYWQSDQGRRLGLC
jgi:decaprenylphospho-beta-D-ribofuranose 2-oxidase